jgi:hypothetical protein
MPLPNGVDPLGRIQTTCPSAGYLGNRGVLHDDDGVIIKPWKNKSWITCALHFGGRNRQPLMQPRRYSELFFLDEATSLAAGHRPCGECRREDYKRFKAAWASANGTADVAISIDEIDKTLHAERLTPAKTQKRYWASLIELPHGIMFEDDGDAYLHWHQGPLKWTPAGYERHATGLPGFGQVSVLTPMPVVNVIRAGYVPQVHSSAN